MHYFSKLMNMWSEFCAKAQPVTDQIGHIFYEVGKALAVVWKHLVKMYKIVLAVPVAWAAVVLALQNMQKLPDRVGLNLQENGTFTIEIIKELAVLGPIAVTALCLLLMFCSRRTLTPWFVSIVSLALPVIILLTNTFPA